MIIKIEALQENSYQAWLLLWQDYLDFYQSKFDSEIARNTWLRLTDSNKPNMYGFIAYQNHQAVGIVHVIEHESCWTDQPYAYLQDLFTVATHRGQGIGRQLIEQVYQIATQRQCDRVYWLTHENNEAARSLYDRVAVQTGFIQYKQSL